MEESLQKAQLVHLYVDQSVLFFRLLSQMTHGDAIWANLDLFDMPLESLSMASDYHFSYKKSFLMRLIPGILYNLFCSYTENKQQSEQLKKLPPILLRSF